MVDRGPCHGRGPLAMSGNLSGGHLEGFTGRPGTMSIKTCGGAGHGGGVMVAPLVGHTVGEPGCGGGG